MEENTHWTPFPDDNLLGITDKNVINEHEAQGITRAELLVFGLEIDTPISTWLILDIHKTAFAHLYEWAGKWRTIQVNVGQLEPPPPNQVLQRMYQFIDNLNYKISIASDRNEHISCIVYAHYEFIKIHPFNNGNGRKGRILMNIVAMKFGYQPLEIYHREGDSRKIYIEAMKAADNGNYALLEKLIAEELTPF